MLQLTFCYLSNKKILICRDFAVSCVTFLLCAGMLCFYITQVNISCVPSMSHQSFRPFFFTS